MRDLVVIAHDIRSTHNVGSLLRTAEGLGVRQLYFTGYTPYPQLDADDPRLPHLAAKLDRQIAKTALGAESLVDWSVQADILQLIADLQQGGYQVVALEQAPDSLRLPDYRPPERVALLLGREVEGIDPAVLRACDVCLEIPMFGHKESFNVVQAAAMALYQLRFA
jgi:tRNA G18 (ribose-2'-O)-methylase SpoU